MFHVTIDRHPKSNRGHVTIDPEGGCLFTLEDAKLVADRFAQERLKGVGWDWLPDGARLNQELYAADVWDEANHLRYHVYVRSCKGLR